LDQGGTMKKLQALRGCCRAATAVEYGLILALIFLAMVGSLTQVSEGSNNMWNNVSTKSASVL
jgi:pilus assembly protein Flp/PilA